MIEDLGGGSGGLFGSEKYIVSLSKIIIFRCHGRGGKIT